MLWYWDQNCVSVIWKRQHIASNSFAKILEIIIYNILFSATGEP